MDARRRRGRRHPPPRSVDAAAARGLPARLAALVPVHGVRRPHRRPIRSARRAVAAARGRRARSDAAARPACGRWTSISRGRSSKPKFFSTLVTAFGALAVTLALIGIYAMMAWSVSERRQEFAIRLALGARSARAGADGRPPGARSSRRSASRPACSARAPPPASWPACCSASSRPIRPRSR